MSWKRQIVTPKAWKRLVEAVQRTVEVLGMAVSTPKAVDACAFHFSAISPAAPISRQIASSYTVIACRRPEGDAPFRSTGIQVLKGQPIAPGPSQLINGSTRHFLRSEAGLAGAHGSERGLSSDYGVRQLIHRCISKAKRRKGRCF